MRVAGLIDEPTALLRPGRMLRTLLAIRPPIAARHRPAVPLPSGSRLVEGVPMRPFRIEVPQSDLDDLHRRLDRHPLAGRDAGRRLGPRGAAGVPEGAGRVLAHRLRLAGGRGAAERVPAVRHRDRRRERALPARPVARTGRDAADPDARLARHGRRVPRRHRAADRSRRARRRCPATRSTWSSRRSPATGSPARPARWAGTPAGSPRPGRS